MTRLGVLAVAAGFVSGLLFAAPAVAAQPYPINYKTFDLSGGTPSGVTYSAGSLTLASDLGSYQYADPFSAVTVLGQPVDGSGTYDSGTWTSEWTTLNFRFTELVSSWNSKTPSGTWIQSEVQPKLDDGHIGQVVHPRALGVRRLRLPPHLGGRPGRRGRIRLDRHLLHEGSSCRPHTGCA